MQKINVHLKSIKYFSFKESVSIFLIAILKKISMGFHMNIFNVKITFDNLINSGHNVIKFGQLNKIELLNHLFGFPVNFYVRRKATDVIIFNEILYSQEYKHLLEIQNKIKCEVRYIVDAGANIGSATIYLNSVFPNAHIVSIEPENENYLMLLKNIAVNNLKNVSAFKGGLWHKDTWLEIKEGFRGVDKEKELSYYVVEIDESQQSNSSLEGITVLQIMEKYSFPYIDILKIDIEGAERFLFNSLESTAIILKDVKILAIEVHEEVMNKFLLVDYLEKLKFKQITFGEILYAYRDIEILNKL